MFIDRARQHRVRDAAELSGKQLAVDCRSSAGSRSKDISGFRTRKDSKNG